MMGILSVKIGVKPLMGVNFSKDETDLHLIKYLTFYKNTKDSQDFWLLNKITGYEKDKNLNTINLSLLWPYRNRIQFNR